MGFGYVISPAEHLVIFEAAGEVSFREWAAGVSRALLDPAYEPGCLVLLDRRRVTSADDRRFVGEVLNFLDRYQTALHGTRWAILVGDEPAAYGAARMLAIRASGRGVAMEAFTELEQALWWLHREAA